MSQAKLPERASLEYLKKLAKERLQKLRKSNPAAKLSAAQLALARERGFTSWRALKAGIEQQQTQCLAVFFEACAKGDIQSLRKLLEKDRDLVQASRPHAQFKGWTGLHEAARHGRLEAVRLLLKHGANPNARESGDNTYPLHWAAAHRHLKIVRALLDAGGDVHGFGDLHEFDVIGWATYFHATGADAEGKPDVIPLLLERGAHHHIFSAMCVGDLDLIRKVVEQNPKALDRRMSRFEQALTPLHFAIDRKRYDILDLLISLGADLEAKDKHGLTALEAAMLHGDRKAMTRLRAAGAKQPKSTSPFDFPTNMSKLASTVRKCIPMINVPDVAQALEWYVSIGFKELGRYADDGHVNWGIVSMGGAELMLNMHGKPGMQSASLWFYTDQVDDLYQTFKSRQLEAAQTVLEGEPNVQGIEFVNHIYDPFYGGREFSIRDPNGYILNFRKD